MKNPTILYFHIGRGGTFNNSGHKSYQGTKNITEVLSLADSNGQWNFINRENSTEVRNLLNKRNLTNLLSLFEKCQDNDNDFTEFEQKTKLKLGKLYYTDGNGNLLISMEEAETGIGNIDWDGDYDTDICKHLHECNEEELKLIADSNEWDRESVLQEYFDNHTDLQINWSKFNEEYWQLIDDYYNNITFDVDDFYKTIS